MVARLCAGWSLHGARAAAQCQWLEVMKLGFGTCWSNSFGLYLMKQTKTNYWQSSTQFIYGQTSKILFSQLNLRIISPPDACYWLVCFPSRIIGGAGSWLMCRESGWNTFRRDDNCFGPGLVKSGSLVVLSVCVRGIKRRMWLKYKGMPRW